MVLSDTIDVTPQYTISTIQTQSDIANSLINAILITLIIININIIVTKLILTTRKETFDYEKWVRSYIFFNSDDLLSIPSWLRHQSFVTGTPYNREKQPLYKRRLVVPLLARAALFVATIGSIVIGIPGERPFHGCDLGDYGLTLPTNIQGDSRASPHTLGGVCREIEVHSDIGTVHSTISFCKCQHQPKISSDTQNLIATSPGKKVLSFKWGRSNKDTNRATGKLEIFLSDDKIQIGQDWYLDIRMDEPQLVGKEITRDFRIEFPHPADDRENIGKNMSNIIQKGIESCSEIEGIFNYENSGNSKHYYFLLDGCSGDDDENVKILGDATNAYFNHLTWTRFEKVRRKVPVFKQRFGEETEICTTEISASRPIVNMLPLLIMLVTLFILSRIISLWTSRRGNTLEEVFLLIKDTFGLDVTCNPLETAQNISVPLKKYRCLHGDRQHFGYLRGVGDEAVEEFVPGEVVSFCGCIERGDARYPDLERNV